jgi:hypothetical protein
MILNIGNGDETAIIDGKLAKEQQSFVYDSN